MITFEEAFGKLHLPEFLNGHEYNVIKIWQSKEFATDVEVARRMQDLYDEICSARFALINSCRNEYNEFLSFDTNYKGHLWIKSQFLNNAIIWYNNSFDILLQVLWFHYKMHNKELCNENYTQIIEDCKNFYKFNSALENKPWYNHFDKFRKKYLYNPSSEKNRYLSVRDLANTIKHRRMLRYDQMKTSNRCYLTIPKEQSLKEFIKFGGSTLYDSSKTIEYLSMEKVSEILFSFHEDLVNLSKEIVDDILKQNK